MSKPVVVSLLVLAAAALFRSGGPSVCPAAAQARPAKAQWEYAVMFRTLKFVTNEVTVRLRLPDKAIEAKSLREVCQQLGRPVEEESTAVALNVLGEEGWELVAYSEAESVRDVRLLSITWVFKRPK